MLTNHLVTAILNIIKHLSPKKTRGVDKNFLWVNFPGLLIFREGVGYGKR